MMAGGMLWYLLMGGVAAAWLLRTTSAKSSDAIACPTAERILLRAALKAAWDSSSWSPGGVLKGRCGCHPCRCNRGRRRHRGRRADRRRPEAR